MRVPDCWRLPFVAGTYSSQEFLEQGYQVSQSEARAARLGFQPQVVGLLLEGGRPQKGTPHQKQPRDM